MAGHPNTFAELFKKYRLKAEIPTLSQFGHLLAEKGFNYEDSIFSHWQNGSRTPQYRSILIKLLEIFNERGAVTSSSEANQFLDSVNQGYLTSVEEERFNFERTFGITINIPAPVADFSGREVLIDKLKKLITGKNTVLLYGPPGVGKTVLAIQLGHLLKQRFPDGVLWYRLDTSDVMDILLSIAYTFGVDVGNIQDKEIRAATVRSILLEKKALLIFDNAETWHDFQLLIPNLKNSRIIITSRHSQLPISAKYESVPLPSFTISETLDLFQTILGQKYVHQNRINILKLAEIIGNLPIALHIFANEIKRAKLTIEQLIARAEDDAISLKELSYENRDLLVALNVSYELLDKETKNIFTSLGIFEGKDFSIEAAAYINHVSVDKSQNILNGLVAVSLVEKSTVNRFRIHPVIKKFIRNKIDNKNIYFKAAKYYQIYLSQFDKSKLKSYPVLKQESNNVLYIFKKCYELQYWDEVISLWEPLENLLFATKQLTKTKYLYQIARNQKKGINIFQKCLVLYLLILVAYWVFLQLIGLKTSFWNNFYSLSLTPLPLVGGLGGLYISRSWGLFKSSIGKSIFFLSVGLISWGIGNSIWSYYNFILNEAVPYPSLADAGFLPSYVFWTIGVIHLPHAIGGRSSFGKKHANLLYIVPFFVLSISYCLVALITGNPFLFSYDTSYIKFFFDTAYPVADVAILTAALLIGISFKFFGGKYKTSIYTFIVGFCFLYIGDFLFSYTTTTGIYFNGGAVDISFVLGFFFLAFGIFGFYFQKEKSRI